VLINNAGIFENESLTNMDFEAINAQLQINAVAPVRVTHALQANLDSGSKVAMITSRMGSIADNGSGAYIGYRMSKAALNAAGVSLAHELKPKGVAVALLHPGFVQTQMVNFAGDIPPQVAAERLIQRIEELNLDNTGSFWHSNGDILPW
jgi:short-subunit dehydrogenase